MTHGLSLIAPLLLAVAVIAAFIDVRSRRIPNWLSLSAFLAGLIVHGVGGPSGIVDALLGCGLALMIYVPLFALQALGAGDVKLMAALGTILGPLAWLWVFVATCLVGGVLAVVAAVSRKNLHATVWNTFHLLQCLTRFESPSRRHPELSARQAGSATMPHALSIAVAACLYVVLPH
ncbi:MAG: A24 family peptidase [Bryobacteraceae bacterium]